MHTDTRHKVCLVFFCQCLNIFHSAATPRRQSKRFLSVPTGTGQRKMQLAAAFFKNRLMASLLALLYTSLSLVYGTAKRKTEGSCRFRFSRILTFSFASPSDTFHVLRQSPQHRPPIISDPEGSLHETQEDKYNRKCQREA